MFLLVLVLSFHGNQVFANEQQHSFQKRFFSTQQHDFHKREIGIDFTAQTYGVGVNPGMIGVGDINNDGFVDVVVPGNNNLNSLSLFQGQADGVFLGGSEFTGPFPKAAEIADLDGDSLNDLIVSTSAGIVVHPNTNTVPGVVSFGTVKLFVAGVEPQGLFVGDINSDGKTDIVATNLGEDTITVLINNGTMSFTSLTFVAQNAPFAVKGADLNGDGKIVF